MEAHILRVCRAENCQSKGSDALVEHVEKRFSAKLGETTADGRFTLYAIYCLGNCTKSPNVMLDGTVHGRMSPEAIDRLIDDVVA
ncbi:MAG: NAD(P)H-dependent oxidoreductase subunit E [Acidobacteriota bacterium]